MCAAVSYFDKDKANLVAISSITLCMIVKDEEDYLQGCLDSVKNVVGEIVIVDTGSTDSTVSIAEKFGAKIYHFDWIDDFSAARNYALQKSTGDWILYLDADERLSKVSIPEIKNLTKNLDMVGIFCTVKSVSNISDTSSMMKYARLFRNVHGLKFSGKVHEQIEESLKNNGCKIIDSGIEIIHLGYDVEQDKIKGKAERNLKLLNVEFEANPTGYNAFQLGQTLNILERIEDANKYFKIAADDLSLEFHHRAQAYRQLAAFELKNKNYEEAEAFVNKGLSLVPESPLLNIVKANILLETGKDSGAVKFCKSAYENNRDFINGEKVSPLEQTVNENNMLLYGINLSIAAVDSELFDFFYVKLLKHSIVAEDNKIIRFYKKILFNEKIKHVEIKSVLQLSSKIDYNILIKNLLKYKVLNSKIDIIEAAYLINKNNLPIRERLYSLLFSNGAESPLDYLEKAYELNPHNLEVGLHLLNAYLSANKISELLLFIDKAVQTYSTYPNIVEKFENIRYTLNKSQ